MRKNVLQSFYPFENVDISTDQTSNEFGTGGDGVSYIDNIGMIVNWSGTAPVGDLYVEVSNSPKQVTAANAVWERLIFDAGVIAISGNTGSHQINIKQIPYQRMRLFYDRTSGTGQLTVAVSGKMV